MFTHLGQAHPVSRGIHFYGALNGHLVPTTSQAVFQQRIVAGGFIIGMRVNRVLCPIYDGDRRRVVVRLRDYNNVLLATFYVRYIPYHRIFTQSPSSIVLSGPPPSISSGRGHNRTPSIESTAESPDVVEHPLLGKMQRRSY